MSVVPHRFLFRYAFPVAHVAGLPGKGGKPAAVPETCLLADLGELDAGKKFAQLRLAWNSGGLGIGLRVAGKKMPLACNASAPAESDGLQVWIDTRNTQGIHRASRFCHHFCFLPAGGGKKGNEPVAAQLPIAQAREEGALADPDLFRLTADVQKDGYRLDVWIPARALNGFDAEASPFLGFYYCVRDRELGEQYLSVGRDFPFAHDPSLWSTLELVR